MTKPKLEPISSTPEPTPPATATAIPKFPSLDDLRLPQHFMESIGVKKLLLNVPVRKPARQEFVRTHPDSNSYTFNMLTFDLRTEGRPETYLVLPEVADALDGEARGVTLFTTISRQHVVFLWPIAIPPPDTTRPMGWWTSAREAAELAREKWLRLKPNMSLGAYEVFLASDQIAEPQWPEDLPTMHMLLELAAKGGRLISTIDHPVIKAMRGG
jgi:hypothetical protein